MFTPRDSFDALEAMYNKEGKKLYGPCGFRDAFNLDENWYANEYLAIDQGITVLMLENYRSGLIWKYFMRLLPIRRWIEKCNLR